MTAKDHASGVELRRQPVQRRRHLRGQIVQALDQGQMILGGASAFQRLPGQAWGALARDQRGMGQMIVEDDIADPETRDRIRDGGVIVQQMGLHPQLRAHVGAKAAMRGQRLKESQGEIRPAHPAFPAPELRQKGGGDPVGGQLGLGRGQPLPQIAHRAAPWRQMPFEPVPVHVDDTGQHAEPRQIDPARLRVRDDPPFGQ